MVTRKQLKIGVYNLLRNNDPVLEAKNFLSVIVGLKTDCKDAIEVEIGIRGNHNANKL